MSRDGWQIEAAIAKRKPLPDWYEDEPPLFPGDEFYLQSFWDLSTCRAIGMSPGPIPWTAIVEYARYKQLDSGMLGPFVDIMRRLDAVYLEDTSREMDRTARLSKQSTGAPSKSG